MPRRPGKEVPAAMGSRTFAWVELGGAGNRVIMLLRENSNVALSGRHWLDRVIDQVFLG